MYYSGRIFNEVSLPKKIVVPNEALLPIKRPRTLFSPNPSTTPTSLSGSASPPIPKHSSNTHPSPHSNQTNQSTTPSQQNSNTKLANDQNKNPSNTNINKPGQQINTQAPIAQKQATPSDDGTSTAGQQYKTVQPQANVIKPSSTTPTPTPTTNIVSNKPQQINQPSQQQSVPANAQNQISKVSPQNSNAQRLPPSNKQNTQPSNQTHASIPATNVQKPTTEIKNQTPSQVPTNTTTNSTNNAASRATQNQTNQTHTPSPSTQTQTQTQTSNQQKSNTLPSQSKEQPKSTDSTDNKATPTQPESTGSKAPEQKPAVVASQNSNTNPQRKPEPSSSSSSQPSKQPTPSYQLNKAHPEAPRYVSRQEYFKRKPSVYQSQKHSTPDIQVPWYSNPKIIDPSQVSDSDIKLMVLPDWLPEPLPGRRPISSLTELYYTTQALPLIHLLPAAHKALTTEVYQLALLEGKLSVVHARIEELKKIEKWSLRQHAKFRGPLRPKLHWDWLIDEMSWLQKDFKEERRMKIAVCYDIAVSVMEYWALGKEKTCIKRKPIKHLNGTIETSSKPSFDTVEPTKPSEVSEKKISETSSSSTDVKEPTDKPTPVSDIPKEEKAEKSTEAPVADSEKDDKKPLDTDSADKTTSESAKDPVSNQDKKYLTQQESKQENKDDSKPEDDKIKTEQSGAEFGKDPTLKAAEEDGDVKMVDADPKPSADTSSTTTEQIPKDVSEASEKPAETTAVNAEDDKMDIDSATEPTALNQQEVALQADLGEENNTIPDYFGLEQKMDNYDSLIPQIRHKDQEISMPLKMTMPFDSLDSVSKDIFNNLKVQRFQDKNAPYINEFENSSITPVTKFLVVPELTSEWQRLLIEVKPKTSNQNSQDDDEDEESNKAANSTSKTKGPLFNDYNKRYPVIKPPIPPSIKYLEYRTPTIWLPGDDQHLLRQAKDCQYNWNIVSAKFVKNTTYGYESNIERRTPWQCFERWLQLNPAFPLSELKGQYAQAAVNWINQSAKLQAVTKRRITSLGIVSMESLQRGHSRLRWASMFDAIRKVMKTRENTVRTGPTVTRKYPQNIPGQGSDQQKTLSPQELAEIKSQRDRGLEQRSAQLAVIAGPKGRTGVAMAKPAPGAQQQVQRAQTASALQTQPQQNMVANGVANNAARASTAVPYTQQQQQVVRQGSVGTLATANPQLQQQQLRTGVPAGVRVANIPQTGTAVITKSTIPGATNVQGVLQGLQNMQTIQSIPNVQTIQGVQGQQNATTMAAANAQIRQRLTPEEYQQLVQQRKFKQLQLQQQQAKAQQQARQAQQQQQQQYQLKLLQQQQQQKLQQVLATQQQQSPKLATAATTAGISSPVLATTAATSISSPNQVASPRMVSSSPNLAHAPNTTTANNTSISPAGSSPATPGATASTATTTAPAASTTGAQNAPLSATSVSRAFNFTTNNPHVLNLMRQIANQNPTFTPEQVSQIAQAQIQRFLNQQRRNIVPNAAGSTNATASTNTNTPTAAANRTATPGATTAQQQNSQQQNTGNRSTPAANNSNADTSRQSNS